LADSAIEAKTEAEPDTSTSAGHGNRARGRARVDKEIVASGNIGGTGDGGRRGRGIHGEELALLTIVLVEEHEEAGNVGRGFDGGGRANDQ
jgi:hypothetical protein